jgi:hypothetical protein
MPVNMMFTPPNPNFERTVRDVFAQQQLMARLGASLVVVGPGYAELELPCSAVMSWREGHFASSAVAALAEKRRGLRRAHSDACRQQRDDSRF